MSILYIAKDVETHFLHARDISSVKLKMGLALFYFPAKVEESQFWHPPAAFQLSSEEFIQPV